MTRRLRLVTIAGVRRLLGDVSRSKADRITRSADFPAPADTLKLGRVWLEDEVKDWIRERRPNLAGAPVPE